MGETIKLTRAQRRRLERNKNKTHSVSEPSEFSGVPTKTLCESILLLLTELMRRNEPLRDFDDKERFIQGIQMFNGRPYFLAAREQVDEKI